MTYSKIFCSSVGTHEYDFASISFHFDHVLKGMFVKNLHVSLHFFQRIGSQLTLENLDGRKSSWIDCVWSLSVLGLQTEDQLKSILEPEFYSDALGRFDYLIL